jgi:hypothetical protein
MRTRAEFVAFLCTHADLTTAEAEAVANGGWADLQALRARVDRRTIPSGAPIYG